MASISEPMQTALNKQINAELSSAYLYLAMAADFEAKQLAGFANWMRVQAQDEVAHAMKFFHYITERGRAVALEAIDKPPAHWDSPLGAFEASYEHERKVTAMIDGLVDLAAGEKDHATENMLQWFVAEQVEEESSADAVVQQLRMVGGAPGGLFMLDRELGQRTFVPPPNE